MAIPKFLEDLLIISKLGDNPGADNGLSSSGLREKFDEAGVKIQKYINDTLIPALSGLSNPEEGLNMKNDIAMGGHRVTGLGEPVADGDAVPRGYANGHFAPAGYGLGESDHNIPANGSITIRFNSQRHIALIAVQGSHMNNRSVFVVNTYGNGGVRTHIKRLCGEDTILYGILPESADNTNGIVLFNQSTDGYVSASILILFGAYPEVTNGNSGVTAEPFEWDNPPMIPGVEYRTTERWEGKPVYRQLFPFWQIPSNTDKQVDTDVPLSSTYIVSCRLRTSVGGDFIVSNSNIKSVAVVKNNNTGFWAMYMETGSSYSSDSDIYWDISYCYKE